MNRIANSVIDHIHTKFRKYSSYVGLVGSTIAIASLNPWFLPLGIPAYLTGQYLAHKRKNIEKIIPYTRMCHDPFDGLRKSGRI